VFAFVPIRVDVEGQCRIVELGDLGSGEFGRWGEGVAVDREEKRIAVDPGFPLFVVGALAP
jgi:hypothetical protein